MTKLESENELRQEYENFIKTVNGQMMAKQVMFG